MNTPMGRLLEGHIHSIAHTGESEKVALKLGPRGLAYGRLAKGTLESHRLHVGSKALAVVNHGIIVVLMGME